MQTSEYDALIQRLAQLMMSRDDNSGSCRANDEDDDDDDDYSSIDQQPVAGVRILSFAKLNQQICSRRFRHLESKPSKSTVIVS